MTEIERLGDLLFGNPDTAISDIKFFPIDGGTASIEDIAKSIRLAILDVESGGGREIDLSF